MYSPELLKCFPPIILKLAKEGKFLLFEELELGHIMANDTLENKCYLFDYKGYQIGTVREDDMQWKNYQHLAVRSPEEFKRLSEDVQNFLKRTEDF